MAFFTLTQQDVDMGKKISCSDCPIALSIKRKLKRGYSVLVTNLVIMILLDVEENNPSTIDKVAALFPYDFLQQRIPTPRNISAWITAFDTDELNNLDDENLLLSR